MTSGTVEAPSGAAGWTRRQQVTLLVALILGVVIRLVLLPTDGFRPDLDQFVLWVHGIAVNGLSPAYDMDVTFGPVMAYIWGILAAIQPAFQTVTDASDPAIRALMKTPASLADLGLAALVVYALRARPTWAVVGGVAMLLHPAVFDISAWWGQYESIYLLSALGAVVFAINGHNGPAAALVAVSLMTKPQALPFILPFAAWFWATGGWREVVRSDGRSASSSSSSCGCRSSRPAGRRRTSEISPHYQNDVLRDPVAQRLELVVAGPGAGRPAESTSPTTCPVLGPLTLRSGRLPDHRPDVPARRAGDRAGPAPADAGPRAWPLATLLAFCFLTAMHERYSYGALVFLMLLVPDVRMRWLGLAFGVVFTLNLLAAIPPTPRDRRHCCRSRARWASPVRWRC